MLTISGEQAICMFYCEAYNESNAVKLSRLNNPEICYADKPTEPMLLFQTRINQNPVMPAAVFTRFNENDLDVNHFVDIRQA